MTNQNQPPHSIALIIPTLNEAENIVNLVNTYLKNDHISLIIIADSASPDGTADLITKNFNQDDRVKLLDASAQRGRGASIVYAYQWIINHAPPVNAVAVSDADFSHTPDDFPKLTGALENADVVIGSRYAKQSKIVNWPIKRRVFSRAANLLARLMLHVGITDYTNGYRLFTLDALKKLNLKTIDADGFIHLSQELIQWHNHGLKIVEVPTLFVNRERGASNLHLKLVIESLLIIIKLGWKNRQSRTS